MIQVSDTTLHKLEILELIKDHVAIKNQESWYKFWAKNQTFSPRNYNELSRILHDLQVVLQVPDYFVDESLYADSFMFFEENNLKHNLLLNEDVEIPMPWTMTTEEMDDFVSQTNKDSLFHFLIKDEQALNSKKFRLVQPSPELLLDVFIANFIH